LIDLGNLNINEGENYIQNQFFRQLVFYSLPRNNFKRNYKNLDGLRLNVGKSSASFFVWKFLENSVEKFAADKGSIKISTQVKNEKKNQF
jgi:hypothetical protein